MTQLNTSGSKVSHGLDLYYQLGLLFYMKNQLHCQENVLQLSLFTQFSAISNPAYVESSSLPYDKTTDCPKGTI